MQPSDARGQHVRLVEHRDDDLDERQLARSPFVVLVAGPLGSGDGAHGRTIAHRLPENAESV